MKPPPLLVSFPSLDDYLGALADDQRNEHSAAIKALAGRGLPPAVSVRCVATLFGYSAGFVGAMMRRPERYHRIFWIPKGRGRREIQAPKVALKAVQSWLGYHMNRSVVMPDCVYGFVPGRSAVMAAAVHCGSDWVLSLDIRDFFASTPATKVISALLQVGYHKHGAELIASLCCYCGVLSQGSPASPVLSNLVFRDTDERLIGVAENFGVRYTRYADDMVFSGRGAAPPCLEDEARQAVLAAGWLLAERKVTLGTTPRRLKVHGLLVAGDKPRLTKGYRNRIRAFRHLLAAGKIKPADIAKVLGHLAYAKSVEEYSVGRRI